MITPQATPMMMEWLLFPLAAGGLDMVVVVLIVYMGVSVGCLRYGGSVMFRRWFFGGNEKEKEKMAGDGGLICVGCLRSKGVGFGDVTSSSYHILQQHV